MVLAGVLAAVTCTATLGYLLRPGHTRGVATGVHPTTSAARASSPPPARTLEKAPGPALAARPPLGWDSWNRFGCDIDESLIRSTADAMVSSGMRAAGYQYVLVDDCWAAGFRDGDGRLTADPSRFPSGMAALARYVHAAGLRFGIYASAGASTCEGRPGSAGHEEVDAQTFADWGVDYLKYDYCDNNEGTRPAGRTARQRYADMGAALRSTGRPIVFAVCEWGDERPWEWATEIGAQLWRTTHDIKPDWEHITAILDEQAGLEAYAGPGGWNDPDMLEVGNGDLTRDEVRAHVTMWALLNAPLLAGNDLREMDDVTAAALLNPDVLAVDQDWAGTPGHRLGTPGDTETWTKPMSDGSTAIVLLNRRSADTTIRVTAARVGLPTAASYRVRDLWNGDQPASTGTLGGVVPAHGVLAYRVWPQL